MGVLPILKAVYGTSFQMAEKAPPDLILVAVDEPPDRFLNSEKLRGRRAIWKDAFYGEKYPSEQDYRERAVGLITSPRTLALIDLWGHSEICLLDRGDGGRSVRSILMELLAVRFGCRTFELRFSKDDAIPVGADEGRLF